ncbi:unnamed protein product [Penicillium salamii]|nr:unnamed protein product [Penicillium salamii]CAG7959449.1 unnamed protein product [Penicillium salamii]CAG8271276.1 unnamed protein product [Penicillium salamii]
MVGKIIETAGKLRRVIPDRAFNILISPRGHGQLGRPVEFDNQGFDLDRIDIPLYFTALAALSFYLPSLLRYILGNVAPTLLILEAPLQGKAAAEEAGEMQRRSTFRNVRETFRLIRKAQGLYFIRELMVGYLYSLTEISTATLLQWYLFRTEVLRPLAFAISCGLLCEFHLLFMYTTISGQPISFKAVLKRTPGQHRWKRLVVPALVYGFAETTMTQICDFVTIAVLGPKQAPGSSRAGAEVLAVVLTLAFRLLVLLPAQITRTLAEAAFLAPHLETIIPSPTKDRGLKIGELVSGDKPSTGFAALTDVFKPVGKSKYLWLIELHLKKCFLQIVLEAVFLFLCILALAHMS